MYRCPRCGNTNSRYIGYRKGNPYCRNCISFIGEEISSISRNHPTSPILKLDYPLTKEQQEISNNLCNAYHMHQNSLVKAVCGAGKTEIVFNIIKEAVHQNHNVAFAVPRRNVVIDLESRFIKSFPNIKITSIYGGHTSKLDGDLILLTTHQLYRYKDYFDLIILDEVDAFPFYQNSTLYSFLKRSLRGNLVVLSATAPKDILEEFKIKKQNIFTLDVRFHHQPIPVPITVIKGVVFQAVFIIKKLREYLKESKPCFIFVPTIEVGSYLFKVVRLFVKEGMFVSSKTKDNPSIIRRFGNKELHYLITTSILERGVTFSNLQVIVFMSDHAVYSSEMLVQIAGRVGRKLKYPSGDVLFLASKETFNMKEAIYGITKSNESLQSVL